MSMTLPSCPLCRKPFVGSRIVKLHVDRPTTSEEGVEDVELLQRLDAEEAKRQVELEAAVEQSKLRKRALQESLERARQLRKQREEEAEIRKPQPPTVAGKSASSVVAADSSPREIQIDEFLRIFNGPSTNVTRTVRPCAPLLTRSGREDGGGWRPRRDANADFTSSFAPPPSLWGRGGTRARADADLTSPLASSTRVPMPFLTLFSDLEDGNESP